MRRRIEKRNFRTGRNILEGKKKVYQYIYNLNAILYAIKCTEEIYDTDYNGYERL